MYGSNPWDAEYIPFEIKQEEERRRKEKETQHQLSQQQQHQALSPFSGIKDTRFQPSVLKKRFSFGHGDLFDDMDEDTSDQEFDDNRNNKNYQDPVDVFQVQGQLNPMDIKYSESSAQIAQDCLDWYENSINDNLKRLKVNRDVIKFQYEDGMLFVWIMAQHPRLEMAAKVSTGKLAPTSTNTISENGIKYLGFLGTPERNLMEGKTMTKCIKVRESILQRDRDIDIKYRNNETSQKLKRIMDIMGFHEDLKDTAYQQVIEDIRSKTNFLNQIGM